MAAVDQPSVVRALVGTSRPDTGLFAGLLTIISFRCFAEVPWLVATLTALALAGITGSIMSYNDLVDRFHDEKKGKHFAVEHTQELRQYLWWLAGFIVLLLVVVGWFSLPLSVFCAGIWGVGLIYSHVHMRWYLVNNVLVALCSGAPALCSMFYYGQLEQRSLTLSCIFFYIILMREIYKDVEDMQQDVGYKPTVPLVSGLPGTNSYLLLFTFPTVISLLLYPHWAVNATAVFLSLIQPYHVFMIINPSRILKAKTIMDWAIKAILVLVLITQ